MSNDPKAILANPNIEKPPSTFLYVLAFLLVLLGMLNTIPAIPGLEQLVWDISGNKNLVVRVDMNVPIRDKKIQDPTRIKACLPTINYALEKNCKVLLSK